MMMMIIADVDALVDAQVGCVPWRGLQRVNSYRYPMSMQALKQQVPSRRQPSMVMNRLIEPMEEMFKKGKRKLFLSFQSPYFFHN